MTELQHKRGDTFVLQCEAKNDSGTAINLTGWTIKAQIKAQVRGRWSFADTFVVSVTNAASGTFKITKSDTKSWPVGLAYMDIEYTDGSGRIMSTETICVTVVADVTE